MVSGAAAFGAAAGYAISSRPAAAPLPIPPSIADTLPAAAADSVPAGAVAPPDSTRPPGDHPFDAWDAAALPLRALALPLAAAGVLIREGLRLAFPPDAGDGRGVAGRLEDAREWGVVPLAGSVGPRSGPAAGARFTRLEALSVEAMVSWRGSWRVAGRWRPIGGAPIEGIAELERHAEPHFWGFGPSTVPEDRTDFGWRRGSMRVETVAGDASPWRLRGSLGAETNRTGRGSDGDARDLLDVRDPATLYGLGIRTWHATAGGEVVLDAARWDGLAPRGVRAELGGRLFGGLGETRSDFALGRAALTGELPIGPVHGLAAHLRAEAAHRLGGEGVPFTHLPALGSGVGGRGFDGGRFRDHALMAGAVEWRWELWRTIHEDLRIEAFLFGDAGTVADRPAGLSVGRLHASWGTGLRLVETGALRAHGFLAFGEATRVDLRFAWPF